MNMNAPAPKQGKGAPDNKANANKGNKQPGTKR